MCLFYPVALWTESKKQTTSTIAFSHSTSAAFLQNFIASNLYHRQGIFSYLLNERVSEWVNHYYLTAFVVFIFVSLFLHRPLLFNSVRPCLSFCKFRVFKILASKFFFWHLLYLVKSQNSLVIYSLHFVILCIRNSGKVFKIQYIAYGPLRCRFCVWR